jgi:hypothetical protein
MPGPQLFRSAVLCVVVVVGHKPTPRIDDDHADRHQSIRAVPEGLGIFPPDTMPRHLAAEAAMAAAPVCYPTQPRQGARPNGRIGRITALPGVMDALEVGMAVFGYFSRRQRKSMSYENRYLPPEKERRYKSASWRG